ncbi:MAG: ribosome silencing factor [Treponema sp.]|nr:ribosome silencing factor [Treponema sp.]
MENKTTQEKALELARLIQDGKGEDLVVLDISELNSWTDFFVIATVASSTQSQGLQKQVKDYIKENDLEIRKTNKKINDGEDWNLIDLGNIVVHLMSKEAREFYDLEKLWHAGKRLEF